MLNKSIPYPRKIELNDFEAKRYFRRLEEFLGSNEIDKRLKNIEREIQIERGVYRENWVYPNNVWWLGLQRARELCRYQSAKIFKLDSQMVKPLETAVKLSRLYGSMPQSKRKEFCTRILTSNNLTPIFFEIDIAAIFWQYGYTIEWANSVLRQRICEFTATSREHKIEVECKTKTIDAGRMISRPNFYRLVDKVAKVLISRSLFGTINIKVPQRMPPDLQWQEQIEKLLINISSEGQSLTNLSDGTEITINLQKQNDIALLEKDIASQEKVLRNNRPFVHIACHTSKRDQGLFNPIIVSVESKNSNRVLDDVLEDLRDANKQISGNCCAIICCFIPEILPESFDDLKSNSGIANMTKKFYECHSKDCIYAVLYCSDTIQVSTDNQILTGIPGLSFLNPNYNLTYKPYVPIT